MAAATRQSPHPITRSPGFNLHSTSVQSRYAAVMPRRILPAAWRLAYSYHRSAGSGLFPPVPRAPDQSLLQKETSMNYRLIIIGLGLLIFLAAMIPYAYKTRCSSPSECPTTAPY